MTRRSAHLWSLAAALSLLGAAAASRASAPDAFPVEKLPPPSPRAVDFARDVRPILARKCLACHGPAQAKGGLRLHRREDALRGGDRGPAILPGTSAASPLIRFVSGLDSILMPPAGARLTAAEVSTLRAWIDAGAQWPEGPGSRLSSPESAHWAFRPVRRPPVPEVKSRWWVRNPVDAFVMARLEREGVRPSPTADRSTLIRRLSLDLLGLPPTPEEVRAFVQDRRPDAYERLVDRLLASPHFGERWGRHWLDLARYADSDGYEKDLPRPYAFLYRDWVIDAINRDLPFDRFTIEQLAGDLLPGAALPQKTATGFHRNTLKNREGGVDPEEDRVKATVDRVNTTGTVWLGLTVGCAECHTHKYDPITQREYYQLFAFFNSARELDLPCPTSEEQSAYERAKKEWEVRRAPLLAALRDYERDRLPEKQRVWEATGPARGGIPEKIAAALKLPAGRRTAAQKEELRAYYRTLDPELKRLEEAVAAHAKKAPQPPERKAPTLEQAPDPPVTRIHVRGDFLRKGDPVRPGVLAVLNPIRAAAGPEPNRLDLARWLVDPANPLTARVAVNRVWQHLLGRGIVPTPDDFGTRGDPPSHPELLDWLASAFQQPVPPRDDSGVETRHPGLGWSRKALVRLIVTSNTYKQSSAHRPDLRDRDPRNVLLARQNRFRLEAEIVRDLYLAASGLLNPAIGGPSIRPPLPADIAALGYAGSVKWPESRGADRYRRGMYIFFQRTVPYPMLATFDAPDSNTTCTRRERSNTPLQALTLLNDPVFFECAQALGRRIAAEPGPTDARVRRAFRACLAREPSATELARLTRLFAEMLELCRAEPEQAAEIAGKPLPPGVDPVEAGAWVTVARTIMNLDEFVTRE